MNKVSIIVPVYNTEKYLDKCINSLINQTLKDIEIIFVNDGSTDKSRSIIEKYLSDERIILIDKENGGQASARNLGIKKSSSIYIMFIDSDDYVNEDMCEKLYNIAISNDYDIVSADYFNTTDGIDSYKKTFDFSSRKIIALEYLFSGVGPCNKMFKSSFLKENNFIFPEKIIYEDFASIPTLAKYNPNCYYLSEAFMHYVHHEGSTMINKEYKKKYEDIFVACDYLYDNLNGFGYNKELEYLLIYHLLYLGSLNFYKYNKLKQIDKISLFMKEKFPNWKKNEYLKKHTFKEKLLMRLFYLRMYKVISFFQKIKR